MAGNLSKVSVVNWEKPGMWPINKPAWVLPLNFVLKDLSRKSVVSRPYWLGSIPVRAEPGVGGSLEEFNDCAAPNFCCGIAASSCPILLAKSSRL
jgi:hypothetical protein